MVKRVRERDEGCSWKGGDKATLKGNRQPCSVDREMGFARPGNLAKRLLKCSDSQPVAPPTDF